MVFHLDFPQRGALKIAALYTSVSVIWILLSDRAVLLLIDDTELTFLVGVAKGWVFVALTGVLLFYLVNRLTKQLVEAFQRESMLQDDRLRTLHLFERICSNASEAVFAKDLQGCYTFANQKLAHYLGRPVAEVLGRSDASLLPGEDAGRIKELEEQVLRDKTVVVAEETINTALGVCRFITTKGPLFNELDQVIGTFGIAHDVTELKRTEAELRGMCAASEEQRALLRFFFEHVPASVAMLDKNLNHLLVSRRWSELLKVDEADMIGRYHYDVFPEVPAAWREAHRRALAGETIRSDGGPFKRRDGEELWLRWELLPWHDTDGTIGGVVILGEDLTAQHQAEVALQQLNLQLEQRVVERTAELDAANRELDAFAYAVSHDLRAPLRAMDGFACALQEDFGDKLEGEARVYLDQISVASRKMAELIEGILTLSRSTRGALERESVDVSAMVVNRLNELSELEPDRQVVSEVASGLFVRGDPRMVRVLITNLIDNAWKYTGKTKSPHIRVYAAKVRGCNAVCIEDNGAGFDMAYAERLFKPFQRLHRQNEFAGTGIGLATVKRIVQRHGGDITAIGRPGQGAKFTFHLVPSDDYLALDDQDA